MQRFQGAGAALWSRFIGLSLGAVLLTAGANPAAAEWPERPITIISHFTSGGSNDLLARLIAAELAPILRASLVVENRPGGNGNIGVSYAARQPGDGYTLLVASSSALVNPAFSKVPYDFDKDFVPIAYLGSSPYVLITKPDSGLKTMQDFVDRAKKNPGKLNYGSTGFGGPIHIVMEVLKKKYGFDAVHVPYPGLAPAVLSVLAGTTDIGGVSLSGSMGQIRSGDLRAIVQWGQERWPELPDVPTMTDFGFPQADADNVQMLMAPAGTPKPILDRLEKEVVAAMAKPEIREKMLQAGFAVTPRGADYLREHVAKELALWRSLVDQAGIRQN